MRHATLRQLKVFVSAATHLSFTRAAAELHLTPPAVSIQIAQLEREAGQPLFDRLRPQLHPPRPGTTLPRSTTAGLAQLARPGRGLSGRPRVRSAPLTR